MWIHSLILHTFHNNYNWLWESYIWALWSFCSLCIYVSRSQTWLHDGLNGGTSKNTEDWITSQQFYINWSGSGLGFGVEVVCLLILMSSQSLRTMAYLNSVATSLNCKIYPKLFWSFSNYFMIKQSTYYLLVFLSSNSVVRECGRISTTWGKLTCTSWWWPPQRCPNP